MYYGSDNLLCSKVGWKVDKMNFQPPDGPMLILIDLEQIEGWSFRQPIVSPYHIEDCRILRIRNISIFLCSFHANCLCIKYWRFSLELSINHMHPNMLKLCIAQYLSWNQNNINHLLAKLLMICKEEYLWACYLGLHIWKLPDYRRVEKSANNWILTYLILSILSLNTYLFNL